MTIISSDKTSLTPQVAKEEEQLFTSVRAQEWNEFHGQPKIRTSLQISLKAAKKRKEPLEHVLFYGPPGLGKTTLAHLLAREMGAGIKVTSGPAIERAGDLAAILTNLNQGDILFIDEIHRLHKVVEETLYPAMEDFCLDIVVGKGPSAKSIRIDLPRFTLVGATTRVGLLTGALRDRFGVVHRLHFYTPEELSAIIVQAAQKLQVKIDAKLTKELAIRARGTPRIALKLLKRVRDVAEVKGTGEVTVALLHEAFAMLEVDPLGLDDADRRLLISIIDKHAGGPVGLETIAATISEDIGTVEEVLEPYLMQIGFLKRTPRGRMVTPQAFTHLGKKIPKRLTQEELF